MTSLGWRRFAELGRKKAVHEARQTTIIQPTTGWQRINVREIWKFRAVLWWLIWRDIKVRYKQTLLGAAWVLLQPLMSMVAFSLIFGQLAGLESQTEEIPYPLFVCAGLLPWGFFSASVSSACNSVIANQGLITKSYFPR